MSVVGTLAMCAVGSCQLPLRAAVVHDESTHGMLSSDNLSPTLVSTAIGSNIIRGSLNESGSKVADYWTIELEPGQQLDQVIFVGFGPDSERSFLALEFGEQISDVFTGNGLAGGDHIGIELGTTVGNDVLDDLAAGAPTAAIGNGFSHPLMSGVYSFWFQEGSAVTTTFDYEFDFRIRTTGDFNSDGVVNLLDLTDSTLGWNARYGSDLRGADYLHWQRYANIAAVNNAATRIPEPDSEIAIFVLLSTALSCPRGLHSKF